MSNGDGTTAAALSGHRRATLVEAAAAKADSRSRAISLLVGLPDESELTAGELEETPRAVAMDAEGVDGEACESGRDNILGTRQMSKIRGELRDKRQMSCLSRRTFCRGLDGATERFVVGNDREVSPVQVWTKVFNGQVHSQEFLIKGTTLFFSGRELLIEKPQRFLTRTLREYSPHSDVRSVRGQGNFG